jgi:hypothetical protein
MQEFLEEFLEDILEELFWKIFWKAFWGFGGAMDLNLGFPRGYLALKAIRGDFCLAITSGL